MFRKIQSLLLGKTLKTTDLHGEKFSVLWGLPVLSSDAISSVAYASEEILLVLIPILGLAAYKPMLYVAIAITVLLLILVFSYRQTIDNYPHGGGSYIVASENLGKGAGLVAAASLTIDYMLTVAVSTCAGTAAITSAFPALLQHRTIITVAVIGILAIGNLRGMKDSAKLFGIPTYLFMFCIIAMIVTGIFKVVVLGETPAQAPTLKQTGESLGLVLFLKAFAAGCTALTGVEAVSDGIPNFRDPAQKNAKRVLGLLAVIVFIIFGGVSFLATMYKVSPRPDITVTAQIATQIFGSGSIMFYAVQATTAIILIMAANTAFADLPLLLSILAKDGYVPRQFASRGKRLGFSNGIVMLFLVASTLVIAVGADTHLLLPLYAVGVFMSFTLSQFGMFMKWYKSKEGKWKHKAAINGFGALVTAVTCVIIGSTKFIHGAWIIFLLIPFFVLVMTRVRRHYNKVRDNLKIDTDVSQLIKKCKVSNHIIVPIQTLNKSFIKSLNYALAIGDTIEVYHVSTNDEDTAKLQEKYNKLGVDIPLVIDHAPYRNVNETLLKYIDKKQSEFDSNETITIVMPQFVIRKWWHQTLHNQTSLFLRTAIMKRRNINIVTIPYIINE
ncbi:APC family permease [Inconstantimicrobium mannanitabidum]|uniref:Amino acid permease n=1 Tax=Inconstantimicrobium mannanitabidum TaxID=1604901 RepID=A0ACB5RDB9_9CLOT|nr:APC family permease [Clostridium sp. TW13]GKX67267.1 amino acid permease [Clostridium sp. TW13]